MHGAPESTTAFGGQRTNMAKGGSWITTDLQRPEEAEREEERRADGPLVWRLARPPKAGN